jgi:glutamine cyclotransferase
MVVAVGNGGVILTSTDGITWTSQTSTTNVALRQILFDGHDWVAHANGDTILYSHNAEDWKIFDTDTLSNNKIEQICTNGKQILGVNFSTQLYVATSCTIWTNKYSNSPVMYSPVGGGQCYWDGTK